jgi:hypothetical protein
MCLIEEYFMTSSSMRDPCRLNKWQYGERASLRPPTEYTLLMAACFRTIELFRSTKLSQVSPVTSREVARSGN